jgi:hypothetical protein
MKKLILYVLVLLVLAVSSAGLNAQEQKTGEINSNRTTFYFNVGSDMLVSRDWSDDDYYPFYAFPNMGVNMDYKLSEKWIISPECNLVFVLYVPAAISTGIQVSYKPSSYFIGAGLTRWIAIGEWSEGLNWFRINVGRTWKKMKYNLFVSFPLIPKEHYYSSRPCTIGFSASFMLGKNGR